MTRSLTALLLLGGVAPAVAQEAPPADTAEILVTAQRSNRTEVLRGGQLGVLGDKAAMDVPFAVKGYTEALVLNQQPQTLGQVLDNDPAVRTTYAFGNAAELFVIRGFPLFGDDIAIGGLFGIAPRQLVAPELFGRVDVLTGASGFLTGAAPGGTGIGGSVNLMPKRAGDAPLTRATLNFTGPGHVGGAVDIGRRFADDRLGVRVNGVLRRGEVAIDDEWRAAALLGAGIDWRGEKLRLSLDLAFQEVEVRNLRPKVNLATSAVPTVPGARSNYGQPWATTRLRDLLGLARAEFDLADNVMLHASAGARDGLERGIYSGITVTDALTGAATGSALFVPRTDNNEAVQAGLRATFDGAISHEINLGGNMAWQVNRNAFDFLGGFAGFPTNLYAPAPVALPGSGFVGGNLADPFPIARTRLAGLFASDTLGLADDRLLVTLGARLQAIRVTGFDYAGGGVASRYDRQAVTPVAGVVFKALPVLSLYANRIEGVAQGPVAPNDPTIANPGQVFAPIRAAQYEAGAKLELRGVNVSLAAFQTGQPAAFAATPAGGGPAVFGFNGEQRHRGFELSFDAEPVRGLRLIGGLSAIDARLRRTAGGSFDGNRAPGVPDLQVNANAEWDVPALAGFTLTGRVVHTGGQAVDQANSLTLPAWTRLDLGARQVVAVAGRPLTLRLTVDNVANRRFWASAFSSFGTALLQGAPRTVKLSASVDL